MQIKIWSWLKWISLSVTVASLILAGILMWNAGPAEIEKKEVQATERPKTEVDSPVIVERKDGEIIWQLRATEAKQQADGKMHLILPLLTLFTKKGEEVTIDSKQAWFEPLHRNIHFQDHVNVDYKVWNMVTTTLIYDSGSDEIHVPDAFTIKGETISAKGKSMRLFRKGDKIRVDGGIWIQDSDPKWQGVNQ